MIREDKSKLLQDKDFVYWLYTNDDSSSWNTWYSENQNNQELADELRSQLGKIAFTSDKVDSNSKTRISDRIQSSIKKKKVISLVTIAKWGIAAALIGVVSVTVLSLLGRERLSAGNGETADVIFPDGTKGMLNAGSTVTFNRFLWKISPKVKLQGEGYFYGDHQKGFTVKTNDGDITVYGTQFNVYAREDSYVVNCYQGQIGVTINGIDKNNQLKSGESIALNKTSNSVIHSNYNQTSKPSWLSGSFHYNKAEFIDVLSELERQFNVTIVNKQNFKGLIYTGYFNTKDKLTAFKMTLLPMNIKYEEKGNTVLLTSK